MFPTRSSYLAAGALAALEFTVGIGLGQSQLQPPAPPVPMPAVLRDYQPVTAERLKNPEDGNWLSIRRTYDGWGYSPLDQITTANVKSLQPGLDFLDRRNQSPRIRARWSTTASCSSPRRTTR